MKALIYDLNATVCVLVSYKNPLEFCDLDLHKSLSDLLPIFLQEISKQGDCCYSSTE